MWLILTWAVIIGHLVDAGSGLQCYVCTDASHCWNQKSSDGKDFGYVKKNCSSPTNKVCVIETYETLESIISHIRNCSDGVHFSFLTDKANITRTYRRLVALKPNNETACVLDGTRQVCLTLCNTDFCNGPRIQKNNQNGVIGVESVSPFILAILVILYTDGL